MRLAAKIELTEDERQTLKRWARAVKSDPSKAQRSRIILLCAEGMLTIDVAKKVGVSRQKVARWRNRFLASRLAGVEKDFPRSGRRPKLTPELEQKIVKATLVPPKEGRWSLRRLAEHLGITPYFVNVVWHRHNLPDQRVPQGRRPQSKPKTPRAKG